MAADPIDRLTPTRRPRRRAVMRQRWSGLGFLHWTVPVEALRALVPPVLEIDTWEGRAYVGLVPFTVTEARVPPLPPLPGVSRFHEVNVRTYVHRRGHDPGVWFFSLDASNPLVVQAARSLFRLPYHTATIDPTFEKDRVTFAADRSKGTGHLLVRYGPTGAVEPARPDTLEFFLVERYILYAARSGRLHQGQVHHAPYPLQKGWVEGLSEDLVAAAGLPRTEEPPLAHFARTVDVEIFSLRGVD